MGTLVKHGILTMIELKLDKFKKDYALEKLGIQGENVKINGAKAFLYYFNVDIKFILKARIHLLRKKFEEKVASEKQFG